MATHSSILAWRILWTEDPGRLQSMGSQRARHDYSNLACEHRWLQRYLMLCCWCQYVNRLIATLPVEIKLLCIIFPEWSPTENSLLRHLHQGLLHRAPHFHFINIHSQESKIGNSQGRQNSCNRVICQQRYCKCAKPLILEAEFSLFRAGEPMSSSSFTWCFLQGRNKVKNSEGVFTASICAAKFSLTVME